MEKTLELIPQMSGASVLMVMSGTLENGVSEVVSFVGSQAESLRNAGWRVDLGVVDDRTSPQGILRNVRRLKKEIAETRPMLVHAQYGSVTAAVANAIRAHRPLVVSFCGDDLLGTPSKGVKWRLRGKMARMIGLMAARKASAVIVKSHNLFEALPRGLRARTTILPNGVDTEFFTPLDLNECRDRLGWSRDSKVVLFNSSRGSDRERKNPDLARAAVLRTSTLVSDVAMKTMSNNTREEVRLMLNAADCLLVTSLHEGSPNIVKEAMSCNLPVVSVTCGDVAERLRNTAPGSVCEYDAEVIAEALAEVLAASTRSNGREQLISQGLTASAVAARLIGLYSMVVA